jgi:hypothetical protein
MSYHCANIVHHVTISSEPEVEGAGFQVENAGELVMWEFFQLFTFD